MGFVRAFFDKQDTFLSLLSECPTLLQIFNRNYFMLDTGLMLMFLDLKELNMILRDYHCLENEVFH